MCGKDSTPLNGKKVCYKILSLKSVLQDSISKSVLQDSISKSVLQDSISKSVFLDSISKKCVTRFYLKKLG